jgi:hypothetical protein
VTNNVNLNPGPVNKIKISQDSDDSGSWVCADIDYITVSATVNTLPTPTFSPPAGSYLTNPVVTISCPSSGATVRYTTDGTVPTSSSTIYSGALTISNATTLTAMAFEPYYNNSASTAAYYNILQPPALQGVTLTGGGVSFNWTAVVGQSYQVQYTTDLTSGIWNNLGSGFMATNTLMTITDATGPDAQRFYRVVLQP